MGCPAGRPSAHSADVTDGRAGIDAALVRRLIAAQFPLWADLPIRPVAVDGWDNRTYRLGNELTVRLPTADGYVPAVAKEHRWLPVLAPQLPVPVPTVVAVGEPSAEFDRPWSIRRWLPGRTLSRATVPDRLRLADELAGFLRQLQKIDATSGPAAGAHSFFRGSSPAHYDDETKAALVRWAGRIDSDRAAAVWRDALGAQFVGSPVWFHGDIAAGNLLMEQGRLAAVIDFGTCGVGDPACDLVITWTFFEGADRRAFRAAMDQDDGRWARARGWALWKALISLTGGPSDAENLHIIDAVITDCP